MTRPSDVEWEALGQLWQAQAPIAVIPDGLVNRVASQTRRMRLTIVAEVAIIAGLAAASIWYLAGRMSMARVVAVSVLWAVNLGIESFAVWNRRGTWRADSGTAVAYVALLHRRAVARIRVARFVRVATVVQAVAVVAAVAGDGFGGAELEWSRLGIAAGAGIVIAAIYIRWSVWYERRARAQLLDAEAAQQLLERSDGPM